MTDAELHDLEQMEHRADEHVYHAMSAYAQVAIRLQSERDHLRRAVIARSKANQLAAMYTRGRTL